MRVFLQVLVFFALFFSNFDASDFREKRIITLKKDEQKKILVKYGSFEKIFKFRWTLYHNEGLVVFRSYDTIVAQNILYLKFKNQSFKFDIKPNGLEIYAVPYILVKFKSFNYETREATFELFLFDNKMQISLTDL